MKLLIIDNLGSGTSDADVYDFMRACAQDNDTFTVRYTDGSTRIETLLDDATAYDAVIAAGGDGTCSSVIYHLRNTGVPILVFPAGTANLLAANIDSPVDPPMFAGLVRQGEILPFDIGQVQLSDGNEYGFMMMAGAGYDAQIMEDAAKLKPSMKEGAYFAAALSRLNPTTAHFKITLDGEIVEADGIAVLLVNFGRIPGDVSITPENNPCDGMLEVAILRTNNSLQLLPAVFSAILDKEGKYLSRGGIEVHRAKEVTIESDPPMPIQFDGEPTGLFTPLKATTLAGQAKIIVDGNSKRIKEWRASQNISD